MTIESLSGQWQVLQVAFESAKYLPLQINIMSNLDRNGRTGTQVSEVSRDEFPGCSDQINIQKHPNGSQLRGSRVKRWGGFGEQKIAIAAAGSGSSRPTGKHSKEKIGIPFTPERAFGVTIGLIVTMVLHIVGRLFSK
jgi:hypothetical protein